MTQDEIIEMAKQAGWEMDDSLVLEPEVLWYICQGQIETFAKLVAQHEREACAKVCEAYQDPFSGNAMADTIRTKGKA